MTIKWTLRPTSSILRDNQFNNSQKLLRMNKGKRSKKCNILSIILLKKMSWGYKAVWTMNLVRRHRITTEGMGLIQSIMRSLLVSCSIWLRHQDLIVWIIGLEKWGVRKSMIKHSFLFQGRIQTMLFNLKKIIQPPWTMSNTKDLQNLNKKPAELKRNLKIAKDKV